MTKITVMLGGCLTSRRSTFFLNHQDDTLQPTLKSDVHNITRREKKSDAHNTTQKKKKTVCIMAIAYITSSIHPCVHFNLFQGSYWKTSLNIYPILGTW